ncbi:polysaccharide deacetylase family protein [Micromonospora sp. NPDC049679]|uniref:polysaccharide deacetylase family protein n=1 Tax=Micromonospora sp. NPDC049679 TaxID=3155920 RepID=UPI0033CBF306
MHRRTAIVAGVVAPTLLLSGLWALPGNTPSSTAHALSRKATPTASPPPPTPSPTQPGQTTTVSRTGTGPFGTQRTTGTKGVALTFDDGPDPVWTPKLLDQLRASNVKATFCVVGTEVRRHPALVARMVREGHTLCNHSWHHELNLGKLSPAHIQANLIRTNREIHRAAPGTKISYYRQPGGKWTTAVVKVARELGMTPLGWDVDPHDWAKPGAETIRKRVISQARAGSIVLLHDGGGDRRGTLAVCPKLVATLRQKHGITLLR